jgi:DNA-binding NtrC family response regulator
MARILLVEDDPEVLLVFEQVLRDEAYEVDTSETFSGGRDHLELRRYDLLIADGRLPDGTGIGLADIAHAKSIPSLIVTGYPFGLRDGTHADLSGYEVLRKPIRAHVLLEAVARTLG